MINVEESKLIRNTGLADFAIDAMNTRFPLGALNRVDVVETLESEVYASQMILFITIRNMIAAKDLTAVHLFPHLKAAHCGEMAFFAMRTIKETCPDVKAEGVRLNYHEVVVIGRKKNSDPNNILTWGKNAVICDPWAKMKYNAMSFFKVREETPHIPFFGTGGEKVQDHFLCGNPSVIRPS